MPPKLTLNVWSSGEGYEMYSICEHDDDTMMNYFIGALCSGRWHYERICGRFSFRSCIFHHIVFGDFKLVPLTKWPPTQYIHFSFVYFFSLFLNVLKYSLTGKTLTGEITRAWLSGYRHKLPYWKMHIFRASCALIKLYSAKTSSEITKSTYYT